MINPIIYISFIREWKDPFSWVELDVRGDLDWTKKDFCVMKAMGAI